MLKFIDKLDIVKALKISALIIFLVQMQQVFEPVISIVMDRGFGGLIENQSGPLTYFCIVFVNALFQPMILLALAKIIEIKKQIFQSISSGSGNKNV